MTNDENLLIDSDHGLRSKSILFSDSGYGCNRAPTEETPEKRYIEPEILSVWKSFCRIMRSFPVLLQQGSS
jgi:hypothetical protein